MTLPERPRATDTVAVDPFERLERPLTSLLSLLDAPLGRLEPLARFGDGHVALADLTEADGEFVLEVELPGVDKADIDIEVEGRRVIVTAERKLEEREGVLRRRTRVTGSLRHEVWLPADVEEDQIEATLDQGVLCVRLPKAEGARRRHIEVR